MQILNKWHTVSKKALSSHPGQVDFPAGQVSFNSHLPDGQGPRQGVCQLSKQKVNKDLPWEAKLESYLSEGQDRFHVFFEPWYNSCCSYVNMNTN